MPYREIAYTAEGPISCLTLNNPSKINALSTTMVAEISAALGNIRTDEKKKVVILRKAGKHFSAGHDLPERMGGDMNEYRSIFEQCGNMMMAIRHLPKPVFAQARGLLPAGGLVRPGGGRRGGAVFRPRDQERSVLQHPDGCPDPHHRPELSRQRRQTGIRAFLDKKPPKWQNR